MVGGLYNMDWYLLGSNKLLDDTGALFVEDLRGWFVTFLLKFGIYSLESDGNTCVFSRLYSTQ